MCVYVWSLLPREIYRLDYLEKENWQSVLEIFTYMLEFQFESKITFNDFQKNLYYWQFWVL